MPEIYETKDGKIIVECDCGIVHKIWKDENDEIKTSQKLVKVTKKVEETEEEENEDNGKKTKIRKNRFFGN